MGIEKFFSTINRTFDIIKTIDLNILPESDNLIDCTYLFIDFNSIIHNVSSNLIKQLNSKKKLESDSETKIEDLEYLIIKGVNQFIISLLERIDLNKLELVWAGIDGIPTFAKILEQKKRRFIGDFVEKLLEKYSLPFSWSKNNISPGTIFMDKINMLLHNIKMITKNKLVKKDDLVLSKSDYEFYSKIKHFDYSDTESKGEGEMKIIDLINSLKKLKSDEKILFFSPDSDVILLSMVSKYPDNIIVVKYDQELNNLSLIEIKLLKETIYSYCIDRINNSDFIKSKNNLFIDKLIKDLVFIFTIFGNDFLPRCEAIQTNYDFLFMIDIYLINLIDHGYMISDGDIIVQTFFHYLVLLSKHEKRLLFRNAYQNIYQNYIWANENNFLIDLFKLKNTTNFKDIQSNRFSEPFYNFYNNIIYYIDPFKICEIIEKYKQSNKKSYGCLDFYLMDRFKLYEVIKKALETSLPLNLLFKQSIDKLDSASKLNYERLNHIKFESRLKKHMIGMKDLSPREVELYLINNKLDKYYSLFNPQNEFYQNILRIRNINSSYYYSKYFESTDRKNIVSEYLKGFKWVFQYYFTRMSGQKKSGFKNMSNLKSFDETWFYPFYKAPLFETIVQNFNSNQLEFLPKAKSLDIKPIEQLLYITPVRLSDLNKKEFYELFAEYSDGKFKDEEFVKGIKNFIEKHPYYFYNLDEIYYSVAKGTLKKNLFDCSNSSFISKCHYMILNYVVDINQFVSKLRSSLII